MHINVIGAGLAGCEAAMQIASHGIKVHLYEMKPNKKTPAHHTEKYAELVCSNSLKAMRVESAAGLLKEEMRRLDSLRCCYRNYLWPLYDKDGRKSRSAQESF
jgi:methylenetetrahydrofolate--tRNA-(uracil-5-)-methyltransferase